MYEYEYSLETSASPEAVFQLYSDVSSWPRWDKDVEKVELAGEFEAGVSGVMVITGQGALPFTLTSVELNRGFSDQTPLEEAGVVVNFDHILTPTAQGGTLITHRLSITGPAAATVGPQIGPFITEDFPQAVATLAQLAEKG